MFKHKKKRSLRHLMPGVYPGVNKRPLASAIKQMAKRTAKQPKRDNSKIKPEVVAATLIARLYRIKNEQVVHLLDRTSPDPLGILGFLIKYEVEPPTPLLLRCASQDFDGQVSEPDRGTSS